LLTQKFTFVEEALGGDDAIVVLFDLYLNGVARGEFEAVVMHG